MRQQKNYHLFQKQILLMVWLSMAPGLVYVLFGHINGVLMPALIWYIAMALTSFYGMYLYKRYDNERMEYVVLEEWYQQVVLFMYIIFSLWTAVFIAYANEVESNLHYIAIFTQLGASVVASALLVSDRKIFVPILFILMVPLIIYFGLIGTWYGYVLSLFSTIFMGVLIYASNNTYNLIQTNYYNAQHDALTSLHNRRFFVEYMDELSERLAMSNKVAYILLIDLDHFKTINDSLGHDIGDKVLIEVGNRIKNFCKKSNIVARLGGDEFVVVSKEYKRDENTLENITFFVNELLVKLKEPYLIDHHHLYISASIGLNLVDNDVMDVNRFLKEADIAMYEAKESGRDNVIHFNKELEDRVERKLEIEQKLHFALMHKTIDIYYQPQVNKEKKIIGCEALIRWKDNELGVVSPEEFIPIAENTGVIIELGYYVLERTFQTIKKWEEHNIEIEQVSINVSVRQLFYSSFVSDVKKLIDRYLNEKTKDKIVFEITENVLAEDVNRVTDVLLELKALGISFSMDDFGTGYSSLNYLRSLPVDELKIDRTFIEHMLESGADKMMVTTILSISRNFGLKVVIEGVERKEQFDFLSDYHCYAYQGYYFSEALSQTEFEKKYLSL